MIKVVNDIKMYDDAELSTMFGVDIYTVRRIRKRGQITSVRLGHKLWTSENVVKAYLDGATSIKAESQQVGM